MASHIAIPGNPTKRAYAAAIRANIPVCFEGDPGEGKSATINADGAAWGYFVRTLVGSVRDSSDYMGLPTEKDGQTAYLPPSFVKEVNDAPKAILFLDELNTCEDLTMAAQLRLLQERYSGDTKLADTVAIVAAINPASIATNGRDLPPAIANRMMHLPWYSDVTDWLSGVLTNFAHVDTPSMDSMLGAGTDADKVRARSAVTAFLKMNPQLVKKVPTNPIESSKGYPTRRSWTNAMAVLGELRPDDDDAKLMVLSGLVGKGAATEFLAWEATADLVDPEAVLANPTMVNYKSERPDRLFVLVGAVTALTLMRGDRKSWERGMAVLTACARGGKPDAAYPSATTLLSNIPAGARPTEADREAFAELFRRAGRWAA